jgi:hypothetical protein
MKDPGLAHVALGSDARSGYSGISLALKSERKIAKNIFLVQK